MTQRGTRYFPLSDALELFLLDCAARRLSHGTLEFYRSKLSVFIRWCDEHNVGALEELTAHVIRRFLVGVQHLNLSSQNQHNLACAIRTFLNYCIRDELIERSPFDKVRVPKMGKKIL